MEAPRNSGGSEGTPTAAAAGTDAASPQHQESEGGVSEPSAAESVAVTTTKKPALGAEDLREVREDRFLQAALRVRVNEGAFPNCLFLPKMAEECRREGRVPR